MKKSYLMIAAVATTFLASCSDNAVLNDVQDDKSPTVIGFSTYSQKAKTRYRILGGCAV